MASNAVFKRQMYEAIEFLCNIPCGSNQTHRDSIPQEDSINGIGLSPQNEEFYYGENRVNNRMTIRLPGPTNYKKINGIQQGEKEEDWIANCLSEGILDGRMFFSHNLSYPTLAFSVIRYRPEGTQRRPHYGNLILQEEYADQSTNMQKGRSFVELLTPSTEESNLKYHPYAIDDPNIKLGKHRNVFTYSGVLISVVPFVKQKELKKELNEQFRAKHPSIDPSLTLSKIRNLKQEILEQWRRFDAELSTVALAYIYFETLVLRNEVNKANRKLVAAICVVLAFKFSEPKGALSQKKLLEDIERIHSIPARQLLRDEFKVFVALRFGLHVPIDYVKVHFLRLLQTLDYSPEDYLGPKIYEFYFSTANFVSYGYNSIPIEISHGYNAMLPIQRTMSLSSIGSKESIHKRRIVKTKEINPRNKDNVER